MKRGGFILGGATFLVVFTPIIFVTFKQVAGKDYIESENDKAREVAI
jgi:hypothetical protein